MKLKRHYHADKLVRTDNIPEEPKYVKLEDGSVLILNDSLLPKDSTDQPFTPPAGLTHDDLVRLGKAKLVQPGGVISVLPSAVKGVEVLQADRGVHHFTENFVNGGIQEGWLSVGKGKLVIETLNKDGSPGPTITYRILRTPGYYCCHNDAHIPDAGAWEYRGGIRKTKGQWYCEDYFPGVVSPDPSNISGYRLENHYTAVNESVGVNVLTLEQAEQFEQAKRQLQWSTYDKRVKSG